MLMIEKIKKCIIHSAEDKILRIDKRDIEQYLSEVKEAVGNGRYRLERRRSLWRRREEGIFA
ncbi:MAG: hypothetical protein NC416_06390 [Eubacterium sp.]|nr:hypothetical protein [Eubacterium sp.]